MPADDQTDPWVARTLSDHADREVLDVDAFVRRVMARVADAESVAERSAGRGPVRSWSGRDRLTPVLLAAAVVVAIIVVGSAVPGLVRGTTRAAAPAATGSGDATADARPSASASSTTSSATAPPDPTDPASPSAQTGPTGLGTAVSTTVPTASQPQRTLPSTYSWSAGPALMSPRNTAKGLTSLRDPSAVFYQGSWHVFTTLVSGGGYDLGYQRFTQWSQAATAPVQSLSGSAIGTGFRAEPQVFWFAPQKLWYLVFQTGVPVYSTNPDLSDPKGWTAPRPFYATTPELIQRNVSQGYWVNPWVICDASTCHLFSADNRGHLFRSSTPAAQFPAGLSQPVIAAQGVDGGRTTFGAAKVYQAEGTGRFLLTAQAFGTDGKGYLRSWSSATLDGSWTPLADTPEKPFAGPANVTFTGKAWTDAVIGGELLRDGYDQTLTVDPCRLQLLALGLGQQDQGSKIPVIGMLTPRTQLCP